MSLYVAYACPEFSDKDVHEIVEFMVKSSLISGFKEVFRLGGLILTISGNTVSAEPSFSALKRLNTCYRGTQSQERVSGLGLLSIEQRLLKEMRQRESFYDEVIEKFTFKKIITEPI